MANYALILGIPDHAKHHNLLMGLQNKVGPLECVRLADMKHRLLLKMQTIDSRTPRYGGWFTKDLKKLNQTETLLLSGWCFDQLNDRYKLPASGGNKFGLIDTRAAYYPEGYKAGAVHALPASICQPAFMIVLRASPEIVAIRRAETIPHTRDSEAWTADLKAIEHEIEMEYAFGLCMSNMMAIPLHVIDTSGDVWLDGDPLTAGTEANKIVSFVNSVGVTTWARFP